MKPTTAALALILSALGAGVMAQDSSPRGQELFEAIKDFGPAQQSPLGADGGELLQMAMAEAGRQLEAEGAGPASEEESVDMDKEARAALQRLVADYCLKRRWAFLQRVSDDFAGNESTLEDALASDFRTYRSINLIAIPDRVDVSGSKAALQLHYDMALVGNAGQNVKFNGTTRFTFVWEDGKMKLYAMDAPLIFGTSLPANENPVKTSQGQPTSTNSTAPRQGGPFCAKPVSGSGDADSVLGDYRFRTQSLVPLSTGDLQFLAPNRLFTNNGAIVALGTMQLSSVHSVSTTFSGKNALTATGEVYAIKTADDKYAIIKLTRVGPGGGGGLAAFFDFEYQADGTPCF